MQYCAILSQVHRHKDALDQSKEGVQLAHQLVKDLKQLCRFYIIREEVENGALPQDIIKSKSGSQKKTGSRNKSFSAFLSQQEYSGQNNSVYGGNS